MKTKTVAKINDVNIILIDGSEKHVPIKPVCEALGIDHKCQMDKIKADGILSSVGGLRKATGSDGKQYEMFCIPYMYIFGWLFTINPKNVKEESRDKVHKYKHECYTSLFNHFTDQSKFLEQKQMALEKQMEAVDQIRNDFGNAKKLLDEARKKLNHVKEMTFDEWQINKQQLSIEFPNQ